MQVIQDLFLKKKKTDTKSLGNNIRKVKGKSKSVTLAISNLN